MATGRSGRLLASLPDNLRPTTAEDAHAIQDAVRGGEPIGAIKVNAAKAGAVYRGMLAESVCQRSPAHLTAAAAQFAGIEAEIAFRFPSGLAPAPRGYDRAAVAAAAIACPAFDLVGTRFLDFMARTQFERVADGLNAGAFVHGTGHADWQGVDFATLPVVVSVDGKDVFRGVGGHPAGDAFAPVLAYAETVQDVGLPPGTIITTGSFCGLLPVAPGQTIRAILGLFEPIEVTLTTNNEAGHASPARQGNIA